MRRTTSDSAPVGEEFDCFPPEKELTYTNWGRSAIEAAFRADGLGGGTVMLPGFICQKSFTPMFDDLDLTPVLVDIEPGTYQMDPEKAKERIDGVDAVMVVHPFGLPAEMDVWTDLCDDAGITLIEDCVRALGASYDGRVVGSFGDHAVYSLHKVSSVGVGGAVASSSNPETHLGDATYDAYALYHSMPATARGAVSTVYPLEYEPRTLDEITRQEFVEFLSSKFEAKTAAYERRSNRLREALEPLGFQFQPNPDGRQHFLVGTLVPPEIDRNALQSYLRANLHPPPTKVVWANPWVKSVAAERFEAEYPGTKTVSERILCFKVQQLDDAGIEATIETVQTFLDAFTP